MHWAIPFFVSAPSIEGTPVWKNLWNYLWMTPTLKMKNPWKNLWKASEREVISDILGLIDSRKKFDHESTSEVRKMLGCLKCKYKNCINYLYLLRPIWMTSVMFFIFHGKSYGSGFTYGWHWRVTVFSMEMPMEDIKFCIDQYISSYPQWSP